MAYDPNNIFARILRGEIPCHKVYEDEHTLAFMDVMPQAVGHTLVIPKAAGENIYDLPGSAFLLSLDLSLQKNWQAFSASTKNSTGDPALWWEVAREWRLGRRVISFCVRPVRPARSKFARLPVGGDTINPKDLGSLYQRTALHRKSGWNLVDFRCREAQPVENRLAQPTRSLPLHR